MRLLECSWLSITWIKVTISVTLVGMRMLSVCMIKPWRVNPMNVTALKKKAFALLNLKRTEEAVVSFEKALQIDANSVETPIKKFLIQYYSLKGGATKAPASEISEDGSGESEDA